KLGNDLHRRVYDKVVAKAPGNFGDSGAPSFYVHRIPYNYIKAFDFIPYFWNEVDGEKKSEDYKPYCVKDTSAQPVLLAALNSNLCFWWWYTNYEGYHCGRHEIFAFPIGVEKMSTEMKLRLKTIAAKLMQDIQKRKNRKSCEYKNTGKVAYDEFFPRLSKPII